ncbi:hypothetical protein AbraIFM66951_005120 [Aspergillus brasiliensis]|uniref:Zn(2)-C6 fungal-type domain-containing protein n=1 Tax=Aspergillus brasiliensis TaxID=319629 RepID=A0A9W5Z2A3_9EURO|nr:hypothetical protein AbraCBS73388_003970 [Aspergillus brasiliensis]GKZ51184.1 hypothetical protein AbraIFM66951_005120 [Aspergillus brasiliensis]
MTPTRAQKTARKQIASTARLSCEGCTERKKKCDKLIPCTNCRNCGVICVPIERRRLPRGRTRRIEEALLPGQNDTHGFLPDREHFGRTMPSSALTLPAVVSMTPPILEDSDVSIQQIPRHTGELNGFLRDIGTRQEGTEWDRCERQTMRRDSYNSDNHRVVEPPTLPLLNQPRLAVCGRLDDFRQRQKLLHTYFTQIDPIVKIVHRPSLLAYVPGGKCYLQYDLWHPAPAALASAIYYAASCTLSQEACRTFGMDKASLISKYRKDLDCALERADYLVTNDLTVLQAFVISLIALRCHDRSRRFWTMTAIALRIAHALELHDPNPSFPIQPFEKEMRRRLWHAIGWLDMQASLCGVSESMFQSSWLIFQPFHIIDDGDFGPNSEIQMCSHRQFSEATFFGLISHAQETTRYLTVSNPPAPYINDIHKRQQLVRTFKWRVDELIAGLQPEQIDFHWYLKEIAHTIVLFLHLLAFRPLKKDVPLEPSHPSGMDMLKLAVEVLDSRHRVYSNPRTEPWHWLEPLFFPWHALAIALAEVRACEDLSLMESVWPSISQNYARFTTYHDESPRAWLQRSIYELIEQARRRRELLLLSAVSDENSHESARIPLSSTAHHQAPPDPWTGFGVRENVSAPAVDNLLPGAIIPCGNGFASWIDECGEIDLVFLDA